MANIDELIGDTPQGTKHDQEKTRYDLLPPELLEGVARVLTFGATKYAKTGLQKLWDIVGAKSLDLYIAKTFVASVTKNNLGKITLTTPKDKGPTLESGEGITQKEFPSFSFLEESLKHLEQETQGQRDLEGGKNLDSLKKTFKGSYQEAVKFASQKDTCTWIMTTKQGSSEVCCAVNTTTESGCWEIMLRELKPHLSTYSLKPESGERNWELGMDWGRVFGALMRHMWAWWRGEDHDKETGMSHLWHAGCCLTFLIAYEERKIGKDDRPTSVNSKYPFEIKTQTKKENLYNDEPWKD